MHPSPEFEKFVMALFSKTMRLEARCEALEVAIGVVAQKPGLSPEQIHKIVEDVTTVSHQRRLERAEGIDPAIAAELDTRPPLPHWPDDIDTHR